MMRLGVGRGSLVIGIIGLEKSKNRDEVKRNGLTREEREGEFAARVRERKKKLSFFRRDLPFSKLKIMFSYGKSKLNLIFLGFLRHKIRQNLHQWPQFCRRKIAWKKI